MESSRARRLNGTMGDTLARRAIFSQAQKCGKRAGKSPKSPEFLRSGKGLKARRTM
jgi:hypothetical protein